jgi:hypothetical protein
METEPLLLPQSGTNLPPIQLKSRGQNSGESDASYEDHHLFLEQLYFANWGWEVLMRKTIKRVDPAPHPHQRFFFFVVVVMRV